jgi:hypothetical protein
MRCQEPSIVYGGAKGFVVTKILLSPPTLYPSSLQLPISPLSPSPVSTFPSSSLSCSPLQQQGVVTGSWFVCVWGRWDGGGGGCRGPTQGQQRFGCVHEAYVMAPPRLTILPLHSSCHWAPGLDVFGSIHFASLLKVMLVWVCVGCRVRTSGTSRGSGGGSGTLGQGTGRAIQQGVLGYRQRVPCPDCQVGGCCRASYGRL